MMEEERKCYSSKEHGEGENNRATPVSLGRGTLRERTEE